MKKLHTGKGLNQPGERAGFSKEGFLEWENRQEKHVSRHGGGDKLDSFKER